MADGRKHLGATPIGLYLEQNRDQVIESMLADPTWPANNKTKKFSDLKSYIKKVIFPSLPMAPGANKRRRGLGDFEEIKVLGFVQIPKTATHKAFWLHTESGVGFQKCPFKIEALTSDGAPIPPDGMLSREKRAKKPKAAKQAKQKIIIGGAQEMPATHSDDEDEAEEEEDDEEAEEADSDFE